MRPTRWTFTPCCALAEIGASVAAPPRTRRLMNFRRLIAAPEPQDRASYRLKPGDWKLRPNVCFGSKADICAATSHVRFRPNSDRESGHRQTVMSALPPIADMCGAKADVRFGPI